MMKNNHTKKFSECFWDSEYTSQNGFNALNQVIKNGQKMVKTYEEFLKNRAKIEDEYARKLIHLVKSTPGQDVGSQQIAWDKLKEETSNIAGVHQQVCQRLNDSALRISQLFKSREECYRQEKEKMKRIIKNKIETFKKQADCKLHFHQKCKEFETLQTQVDLARLNPNLGKDYEKQVHKRDKAHADQDNAKKAYRDSLNSLEQQLQIWKKEHLKLSDTYQNLEEERIKYLQNEMWVYSNVLSLSAVDVDKQCECIRVGLEKVDVDDNVLQIIRSNATGSTTPEKVPYEEYVSQRSSNLEGQRGMMPEFSAHPANRPPALPPQSRAVFTAVPSPSNKQP